MMAGRPRFGVDYRDTFVHHTSDHRKTQDNQLFGVLGRGGGQPGDGYACPR